MSRRDGEKFKLVKYLQQTSCPKMNRYEIIMVGNLCINFVDDVIVEKAKPLNQGV